MIATRLLGLASTIVLGSIVAACAAEPPSGSLYGGGNRLADKNGSDDDTGNGGLGGSGDDTDGAGDNGGVTEACATSTANAEQLPLHMVVVLDKSGSMCEYTSGTSPRDCNNASSKWQQVTKALGTFFTSAQSKGITVSLIAFPVNNNMCSGPTYQAPIAADVALPDTSGKLAQTIAGLSGNGSTPTTAALAGAVEYAKGVNTQLAGKGKVAVVMATDGLPEGCSGDSISSASSVAQSAKATVPTYVIGVGNLLNDLNSLANAGGTSKAFIVSTANQATVGTEFSTAMSQIRGASLACEYALPQAPAGQTLDFQKVNVQYSAGGAAAQTLKYSDACSSADGWRYDNVQSPTKILLCQSACDKAKTDAAAKIDLVLGCQTNGAAVK
jgi:Mg-chelatase subunit ChlD